MYVVNTGVLHSADKPSGTFETPHSVLLSMRKGACFYRGPFYSLFNRLVFDLFGTNNLKPLGNACTFLEVSRFCTTSAL